MIAGLWNVCCWNEYFWWAFIERRKHARKKALVQIVRILIAPKRSVKQQNVNEQILKIIDENKILEMLSSVNYTPK